MTQKQIYDVICDLAYAENTAPEEYVLGLLRNQNSAALEGYENMPDEVKQKLISAEKFKNDARDVKKRERSEQAMREDIENFRHYFPEVKADDIPESVWADAANGIPLAYSYALHLKAHEIDESIAKEANNYAETRAIPIGNDESEAPYTKEDVENMSQASVKNNYKKILNSIKGWKF